VSNVKKLQKHLTKSQLT